MAPASLLRMVSGLFLTWCCRSLLQQHCSLRGTQLQKLLKLCCICRLHSAITVPQRGVQGGKGSGGPALVCAGGGGGGGSLFQDRVMVPDAKARELLNRFSRPDEGETHLGRCHLKAVCMLGFII